MKTPHTCVYLDSHLADYNFGIDHPFGPQRHQAFEQAFHARQLDGLTDILSARQAAPEALLTFHTRACIEKIIQLSRTGQGYLDQGDTPAFRGMYEVVLYIAGSVLDAVDRLMRCEYRSAFVPIAGLHHARRDRAAGFCIINDCGLAIEHLLNTYNLERIAYIDIDAHHGDGVFYSFEKEPRLIFADIHEDGQYLYPGTGRATETGRGRATGCKLNIPMPPEADDAAFLQVWQQLESFIDERRPEFIILQCGADSLQADPITHLAYSQKAHAHAARRLRQIADKHCAGKLLALGGGGYNLDNIGRAWSAVVEALAA